MSALPEAAGICAVITTYRPDEGLPDRVARIRNQVGRVVIVDDGDYPENVARLRCWFSGMRDVLVHHHRINSGIAAALNTGVSIARREGYSWVLTLDDDTTVAPDMVENLVHTWRLAVERDGKAIGIMGMLSTDAHTGKIERSPVNEQLYSEKRGIITSGSLLPIEAYEAIGPFREEFFIDSVDYDYCLRARAQGFRVIKVRLFGMIHPVGRVTQHGIGKFTVETTNHRPWRRYYAYRNSTVLAREHFTRDPKYSFAVLYFQLKTWFLVLLFEQDKQAKAMHMFRGSLDGLRRRLGRTVPIGG